MTFTKGQNGAANGGHWPAGKRRNADTGDWETIRLGITSLIDEHFQRGGSVSSAALARACNVDRKTTHKWLKGENRPSEEYQDICRVWLRERRDEIKRRKATKS